MMRFTSIKADFHDDIAHQGLEMWQIFPQSWRARFQLAWRVFAYPSKMNVVIFCDIGAIEELANAQR